MTFVPDFYSLPPVLDGILTAREYNIMVYHRASATLERDRRRKIPGALAAHVRVYSDNMNDAVCRNCLADPYTGDRLNWGLARQWNDKDEKDQGAGFSRKFALMPTFSHVDLYGDTVNFEVCSWMITTCKSGLTGAGFVDLCNRVIAFRDNRPPAAAAADGRGAGGAKGIYFPPDWLLATITAGQYKKWILKRAKELHSHDRDVGRPYALVLKVSDYCKLLDDAVHNGGRFDPFTGDELQWRLIGQWDVTHTVDPDGSYYRKFALAPAVDHVDPEAPELKFEICSNQVNLCKSYLSPDDFVALCRRIAAYRKA